MLMLDLLQQRNRSFDIITEERKWRCGWTWSPGSIDPTTSMWGTTCWTTMTTWQPSKRTALSGSACTTCSPRPLQNQPCPLRSLPRVRWRRRRSRRPCRPRRSNCRQSRGRSKLEMRRSKQRSSPCSRRRKRMSLTRMKKTASDRPIDRRTRWDTRCPWVWRSPSAVPCSSSTSSSSPPCITRRTGCNASGGWWSWSWNRTWWEAGISTTTTTSSRMRAVTGKVGIPARRLTRTVPVPQLCKYRQRLFL